jgi:hypothetical protein
MGHRSGKAASELHSQGGCMEIDITRIVTKEDCSEFSASIAETGLQNIGKITWENACKHAASAPLCTFEQQDNLREYLAGFGAWDREELDAMSDTETNALLLQFVASAVREMGEFASDEDYRAACEQGRCSGEISQSDDGRFFFYVGM